MWFLFPAALLFFSFTANIASNAEIQERKQCEATLNLHTDCTAEIKNAHQFVRERRVKSEASIYFQDRATLKKSRTVHVSSIRGNCSFSISGIDALSNIDIIGITPAVINPPPAQPFKPELITLYHEKLNREYQFPVDRRLEMGVEYKFGMYDAYLPKNDPAPAQRKKEIKNNKSLYKYAVVWSHGSKTVISTAEVPPDEQYTEDYLEKKQKQNDEISHLNNVKHEANANAEWKSYDEMIGMYAEWNVRPPPLYATLDFLKDEYFGRQRVQGINPGVLIGINSIPPKLKVNDATVQRSLKDTTLSIALRENKIFMMDFWELEGIRKDMGIQFPAPIGLFYLNNDDKLIPIAIQLFQKTEPDNPNPVFTPHSPPETWLLAKMYFNLADSSHHQGISHFGSIHFLMERIIIAAYRNLSPSHPVFRLMKPHFLFTIAVNRLVIAGSASPSGIFSEVTTLGGPGILYLTTVALEHYNMSLHGNVHELFKNHKATADILKYYPYRDDITKSYDIVRQYVSSVIKYYYKDNMELLTKDDEIQAWRKELGRASESLEGCGIKGVPGSDNNGFQSLDQLIETVTAIIHTASCKHSVVNYMQYDCTGFPPNYPGYLKGPIPTTTADVGAGYVLKQLPRRAKLADIIMLNKGPSTKYTNMLGNFEVPTLYEGAPEQSVNQFRNDVAKASREIRIINKSRQQPFPFAIPQEAPNAVSQ